LLFAWILMPVAFRITFYLAVALFALGSAASGRAMADGADLFAPSWEVGQTMDANRALAPSSFYDFSPSSAAAGSPVRAEAFSGERSGGCDRLRFMVV
jgi:hypothetical protein